MPTSDAGTPRSLRLTAGLDTLTVSGLDETASETLCRDWSRCSPTPRPTPAAAASSLKSWAISRSRSMKSPSPSIECRR